MTIQEPHTTTTAQGVPTAYQNPAFLGNSNPTDMQGYVGPSASANQEHHLKTEGGIGPLDEPRK